MDILFDEKVDEVNEYVGDRMLELLGANNGLRIGTTVRFYKNEADLMATLEAISLFVQEVRIRK